MGSRRVFTSRRPALASDREPRPHKGQAVRLPRPVPPQLSYNNDSAIQFLNCSTRGNGGTKPVATLRVRSMLAHGVQNPERSDGLRAGTGLGTVSVV